MKGKTVLIRMNEVRYKWYHKDSINNRISEGSFEN